MKDRERIEKERRDRFERLRSRSDKFQEKQQFKKKEEPEEKTEPEEREYTPSGVGIGSAVVTVLVVAVMVIIGAITYGFVRDAIVMPLPALGSATNATVNAVPAVSGFDMLSVSVIVLAAVAILGIVLLLGAVSY